MSDETHRVSVVVAVRNGERFLATALDSILSQEYPAHEIIVIDGQSTDGTPEIAKRYPQVKYVLQPQLGIPQAYNMGIAAAQGDLVAFISHDDLWMPSKLRLQVERLVQHPQLQYVTCKIQFFLEDDAVVPSGFRKEWMEGPVVAHIMETLLARRTLFSQVGMFDPAYPLGHDVDWFARAQSADVPTAVVSEVLVRKRVHQSNASLNGSAGGMRELLRIVRASIERKRQACSEHH